jgi:uncharacterized protein with GYD domain
MERQPKVTDFLYENLCVILVGRANKREEIVMHFCFTAQYTSQAINAMMDDPATNRAEAIKKLLDAAGAKLVSLYNYPADGPGVMLIFDVPDPEMAPAIAGVAFAGGAIQNVKLTRLLTQDELKSIQQKGRKLRAAYKPPGK